MKEELDRLGQENEHFKWKIKETEKKAKPNKRLEVIIEKRDKEIETLKLKLDNLETEHALCGAEAHPSGTQALQARHKVG